MHLGMLHHLLAPVGFPVRALESFSLMMNIVLCTFLQKCGAAAQQIAGRVTAYLKLVKQLINLLFDAVGFFFVVVFFKQQKCLKTKPDRVANWHKCLVNWDQHLLHQIAVRLQTECLGVLFWCFSAVACLRRKVLQRLLLMQRHQLQRLPKSPGERGKLFWILKKKLWCFNCLCSLQFAYWVYQPAPARGCSLLSHHCLIPTNRVVII